MRAYCSCDIKNMSARDIPPDPRRHKDVCEELCHRNVVKFVSRNGRFRVWNSLTGEDLKGESASDTLLAFSPDGYAYLCHQEKTTWISEILKWSVWKHIPSGRIFATRFVDGSLEQVWLDDFDENRYIKFLSKDRVHAAHIPFPPRLAHQI